MRRWIYAKNYKNPTFKEDKLSSSEEFRFLLSKVHIEGENEMLMVSHKTGHYPVQSVQDLRRSLENKGILFLELEMPRQVGKTTMLNALALGYSQLEDNRVLLMTHNSPSAKDQERKLRHTSWYLHENVDVISSGRIKNYPEVIKGIKYDVILIDEFELHDFSIPELVGKLELAKRTNTLKALVMVR